MPLISNLTPAQPGEGVTMTAPNRIREMRLRAKLTQQQAGERMGYPAPSAARQWWALENSKWGKRMQTLERVAEVLGCTVHELI